jgi:hypothetical protein
MALRRRRRDSRLLDLYMAVWLVRRFMRVARGEARRTWHHRRRLLAR